MKLILSSSSPRRQEIMDMFDIEYIVDTTDVERTLVLTSTPHINAMVSAFMKAASVYEKNIDGSILKNILKEAASLREAGNIVLVSKMNKNKKFQKEGLEKQGYVEFKEFYREALK